MENNDNIYERVKKIKRIPRKGQPMAYAQGNKWMEENAKAVGNNN